jgi:hypothetical protein
MVGGFEDRPHGRIESWLGLAMGEEDGECAEDSELRPSHGSDLGLVWFTGICGDGRVLSWPIPKSPLIPRSPFGTRVLGQKNTRLSPGNPVPDLFLSWTEYST